MQTTGWGALAFTLSEAGRKAAQGALEAAAGQGDADVEAVVMKREPAHGDAGQVEQTAQ